MTALTDILDRLTVEGDLVETLPDGAVRCTACGHRCLVRPGKRGICGVRFNEQGHLRVPWGYVAALQADPIEKKPFSHLLPGATALTFGMLGCDYHCGYCQNWLTSQAARDPASDASANLVRQISPAQMVEVARHVQAQVVVSSYNEPLITSEWAVAIFKEARAAGLMCAYVSNGNNTPEVMKYIRPYIDAYKVDLKSMNDRHYRQLGGVLQNTLDGIRRAYDMGLWVEVVTLVIPGFNDSTEELWQAARFLRSVSADIPWHVTAFHKDYKMTDPDNTPAQTLLRAAEIGHEAGLNFVYAGNLPGRVDEHESTFCPKCNKLLVRRSGYVIVDYHINGQGSCPACGTKIPGVWPENPRQVNLRGPGIPLPVY